MDIDNEETIEDIVCKMLTFDIDHQHGQNPNDYYDNYVNRIENNLMLKLNERNINNSKYYIKLNIELEDVITEFNSLFEEDYKFDINIYDILANQKELLSHHVFRSKLYNYLTTLKYKEIYKNILNNDSDRNIVYFSGFNHIVVFYIDSGHIYFFDPSYNEQKYSFYYSCLLDIYPEFHRYRIHKVIDINIQSDSMLFSNKIECSYGIINIKMDYFCRLWVSYFVLLGTILEVDMMGIKDQLLAFNGQVNKNVLCLYELVMYLLK
jgi:hypothetical protein